MIRHIRNSAFINALWGLMALYLLNISVDTADPFPEHIPEDLNINDQESIVEIFIEQILGFENAIAEYDDNDSEDVNKSNSFKIDLLVHFAGVKAIAHWYISGNQKKFLPFQARIVEGFTEIHSPPPEV